MCALIVQLSASFCVPGAEDQICVGGGSCASGQNPVNCGGHCSEYECQLGAACAPLPDGGDPCAAAGFVCDASNQVCRQPQLFESCAPGGPYCEPFPDSNLSTSCLNLSTLGDGDLCLEPCSETSDCADPLTNCYVAAETIVGGGFCNANQCASNFAKCAAQGAADGLCEPQGPLYSFCHQESLDGGGAVGQGCDFYDNRQRGEFCTFPNICNSGICAPSCNAGTSGVPACAAGTKCFGVQGLFSDPADLGACSVACDFTSPDGGGCKAVAGGPSQKCLPELLLTGTDDPDGFCSAEVAAPAGLGQACGTDPGRPGQLRRGPAVPATHGLAEHPLLPIVQPRLDPPGDRGLRGQPDLHRPELRRRDAADEHRLLPVVGRISVCAGPRCRTARSR